MNQEELRFDGKTFDQALDGKRLTGQLHKVFHYMSEDVVWKSLREISDALGYPEASISARLRDLRKKRFGSHQVDRRRRQGKEGLWEYRLVP